MKLTEYLPIKRKEFMNNTFDIKRIGLLLRAVWIEHKQRFLISAGLLFIGYILILWNVGIQGQMRMFWLGIFITVLSYYSYAGKTIHYPKGLSLTLPATTFEKFLSLLLVGLGFLIIYGFIYWLCIGSKFILQDTDIIAFSDISSNWQYIYGGILFFITYQLLMYVIFPRFPLLIGMAVIVVIVAVFTRLYAFFLMDGTAFLKYDSFTRTSPVYDTLEVLGTGFNPMMAIVSLILLYVVYLKLKEREIK